MTVSLIPVEGATEAMVSRVVHLGFEVRIELELPGGELARAQLTRGDRRARARRRRHRLRPPCQTAGRAVSTDHRVTQASGSAASLSIALGSLPLATSATVTCSTTLRRFLRTAIQTRGSALAAPG